MNRLSNLVKKKVFKSLFIPNKKENMLNKKFLATAFTLSGSIIGAGILGLPYVFSQSGFLLGAFWIIFLGIIITYILLCLGETVLRTKELHQLPGLAKEYLGEKGKWLMFFAVIFGIYSALIAYLIGEGQSLSTLITGSQKYAVHLALAFWITMIFLLREGLKGLKKVETYGVMIIITLIAIITIWFFPQIQTENLTTLNYSNFFLPIGVVLFALIGFSVIPELRQEIKGDEKKLKKAILLGSIIPIIIYIIFSAVFVGVLGTNVPQVATLGLGKLVVILGIFTMLTSYFVLSFSLLDVFELDLKFSRRNSYLLVSIIPLLAYLLLDQINQLNFINILGIGGVISGGLTAILILIMAKKSKHHGTRKPEFQVPINWPIIILLSAIFILGIILELFL